MDAFYLVTGLILIIKGGDLFVGASVRIAEWLNIPRLVIGSTLVSLATTTPELVVSITAGLKGQPGLAAGNAVGSCICNVGLVLGVTGAIKQVEIHPGLLKAPIIALFAASIVLFVMTLDLNVTREQGVILLVLGASYFLFDLLKHLKPEWKGQIAEAKVIEDAVAKATGFWPTRPGTIVQFIAGAILVIAGSHWLVDSAVSIAGHFGVSPLVIGLTVVALGTSLPELATAVTSSRKKVSDLAIGNVLGANIANLSLIIGTAATINEVTLTRGTQLFNFPAMILFNLVLLRFLLTGKRLTRVEGCSLIGLYAIYIIMLIVLTSMKKL